MYNMYCIYDVYVVYICSPLRDSMSHSNLSSHVQYFPVSARLALSARLTRKQLFSPFC